MTSSNVVELRPLPATFDDFWAAYPRRCGKADARKAWAKAILLADPASIVAAASRMTVEYAGKELRYIPHPSTWLNGERYADDPGAGAGLGSLPGGVPASGHVGGYRGPTLAEARAASSAARQAEPGQTPEQRAAAEAAFAAMRATLK